ncbi:universal stress protein [soil metagenome]
MNTFPTKMLLATDGSEEAELALRTAVTLAKSAASELHVVHVFPMDEGILYPAEVLKRDAEETEQQAREFLDRQVRRVRDEGLVAVKSHYRKGRPANEIVKLNEELGVDLVVVGSRGLGGIRRALMGSVSDSVVRYAPCPVLTVRGK